jgi:predicted Zn-dependent peptidase
LALRYAWGELTGCQRTLAGDLAAISQVTAADLQRTARLLFTPERLRGVVVGPYKASSRKTVAARVAAWQP